VQSLQDVAVLGILLGAARCGGDACSPSFICGGVWWRKLEARHDSWLAAVAERAHEGPDHVPCWLLGMATKDALPASLGRAGVSASGMPGRPPPLQRWTA
jgi:hypothetical protein